MHLSTSIHGGGVNRANGVGVTGIMSNGFGSGVVGPEKKTLTKIVKLNT